MKDPAMTRGKFNNSGFQAPALLDLTFTTSPQSVYIHTHTVIQYADKFVSSQRDTDRHKTTCEKKILFLVNGSVWRRLTMCPVNGDVWFEKQLCFILCSLNVKCQSWEVQGFYKTM